MPAAISRIVNASSIFSDSPDGHRLVIGEYDQDRLQQRHDRRRRAVPTSSTAGGGNDAVTYLRQPRSSIDGGTGINTLVMQAAADTINLNSVDQTTSDSTTVSNFQNVDASALSTGGFNHRFVERPILITGGSGNDTIDGNGGADVIAAGGGNDTVTYRTELKFPSMAVQASTRSCLRTAGHCESWAFPIRPRVIRSQCHRTSRTSTHRLLSTSVSHNRLVLGTNTITGGTSDDTIDGAGGADIDCCRCSGNDTVTYHGTETSIDGGAGAPIRLIPCCFRRYRRRSISPSAAANADQTTGDGVNVSQFREASMRRHLSRLR